MKQMTPAAVERAMDPNKSGSGLRFCDSVSTILVTRPVKDNTTSIQSAPQPLVAKELLYLIRGPRKSR